MYIVNTWFFSRKGLFIFLSSNLYTLKYFYFEYVLIINDTIININIQRAEPEDEDDDDNNHSLGTFSTEVAGLIDDLAKYSHEAWAEQKMSDGWKHDPTYDADKRYIFELLSFYY